jgi:hypothetical protein
MKDKNREERIRNKVINSLMKRDLDIICKDCITGPVVAAGGSNVCLMKYNCLRIYQEGIDKGETFNKNAIKPVLPSHYNGDFEDVLHFVIDEFMKDNSVSFISTVGCCISNYNDRDICKGELCVNRTLCCNIHEKVKQYYSNTEEK